MEPCTRTAHPSGAAHASMFARRLHEPVRNGPQPCSWGPMVVTSLLTELERTANTTKQNKTSLVIYVQTFVKGNLTLE